MSEWISVKDQLPDENKYVLICVGKNDFNIAKMEKGISQKEREMMKQGKINDPVNIGWNLSNGYFQIKRSVAIGRADEQGNNTVPYCWISNSGPMQWFGQDVTHWMELPEPPKE